MAGTQATGGGNRGEEASALVILVEGLIDRIQRSPLMRRAPAQCSPEEQVALAGLLADLVALRSMRTALDTFPPLRLDQVSTHWPELGGLLAAARRPGAKGLKPREGLSAAAPLGFFDSDPAEPQPDTPPTVEEVVPPQPEPAPVAEATTGQANLSHLLLEALTVQGRALNATQMLTWLGERGVKASREEVVDTLHRYEHLFRRRGTGGWVVASQDAQ